eukprot:scaffold2507_cov122-Isochrysis_galbana.AAC.26
MRNKQRSEKNAKASRKPQQQEQESAEACLRKAALSAFWGALMAWPSLKGGGIASLHTTPSWDDIETKDAPSDKTDDMCKEAANYYMWLFVASAVLHLHSFFRRG